MSATAAKIREIHSNMEAGKIGRIVGHKAILEVFLEANPQNRHPTRLPNPTAITLYEDELATWEAAQGAN